MAGELWQWTVGEHRVELHLHVHHIATTVQTSDGNAHGIAFYGTSAAASLDQITVDGNEVDHLTLGSSESVVVNGNVEHFFITNNRDLVQ